MKILSIRTNILFLEIINMEKPFDTESHFLTICKATNLEKINSHKDKSISSFFNIYIISRNIDWLNDLL